MLIKLLIIKLNRELFQIDTQKTMKEIFQIFELRFFQICRAGLLKNEAIPKINTGIYSFSIWLNGDYVITIQF